VVPQVAGGGVGLGQAGPEGQEGQVLAVISSSAVSEQRSELLNAEQRLSLARTTYQREKQLWEQKISAEQDYLQARRAAGRGGSAQCAAEAAAIGAAGHHSGNLNRYEIRAPFDGTVVEKHLAWARPCARMPTSS
jgi:cobalt-zinc-cadmium efflux system membrane fusion protein